MQELYIRGVDEYIDRMGGDPDGFYAMMAFSDAMQSAVSCVTDILGQRGFFVEQTRTDPATHTDTITYTDGKDASIDHVVERAGCHAIMQSRIVGKGAAAYSAMDEIQKTYGSLLHLGIMRAGDDK